MTEHDDEEDAFDPCSPSFSIDEALAVEDTSPIEYELEDDESVADHVASTKRSGKFNPREFETASLEESFPTHGYTVDGEEPPPDEALRALSDQLVGERGHLAHDFYSTDMERALSTPARSGIRDADLTTVVTDVEEAQRLLDRVADEFERRKRQGYDPDELVLGVPQYERLLAWARARYDADVEDVLPVEEVIVVPGPMIHARVPNRHVVMEEKDD